MKILYLDLEGVLIDDWFDDKTVHFSALDRIKSYVDQDTVLGLFSFAVSDQRDLETFKNEMMTDIENGLGVQFHPDHLCTVEMIEKAVEKYTKAISYFNGELCSSLGKCLSFQIWTQDFMKTQSISHEFLLVDDTVNDEQIIRSNHSIKLISFNL